MPADAPAHVIGVDPDRDSVTASVVEASTTAEVAAAMSSSSSGQTGTPRRSSGPGLLRRWLPKGTDLIIGAVRLAIIEDRLNTMPRKLVGCQDVVDGHDPGTASRSSSPNAATASASSPGRSGAAIPP